MNEQVKILWRFFYLKAFSSSVKLALAAYVAGVASKRWLDMDWDSRSLVIAAASIAVLTNLESLSDQTASKIAAGKPPIGTNGNTEHFIKAQAVATVALPDAPKP